MTKRSICSLVAIVALVAFTAMGIAEEVYRCPNTTQPLDARWKWAIEAGSKQDAHFWIGYSVPRLMGKNSLIGSFSTGDHQYSRSLAEVLDIRDTTDNGVLQSRVRDIIDDNGEVTVEDGLHSDEKVVKQVGVLFEISAKKNGRIEEIRTSNLSLPVDLDHEPIYWLGEAGDANSVQFLESLYPKLEEQREKKSMIAAIGLHDPSDLNVAFLGGILTSDESGEVRKDAAFWLGQTETSEALRLLHDAALHDRSGEVRENAVFAISRMKGEKADDALIALAKGNSDLETRKKAIFWLGQKASKKATATLREVVEDDNDMATQKSAVFALSQLKDDEGIDPLIKIARTHKNPKIRKEAIFWLGQSENERAIQLLVDIVKN